MPIPVFSRHIRTFSRSTLSIASLLIVGCGGSHTGAVHVTKIDTTQYLFYGDGVTTRSVTETTPTTTLTVTLSTPQSDYAVGNPIPLNLTITNIGKGTYNYNHCVDSATASVEALSVFEGVWDSLPDELTTYPCETGLSLAPGQSVSDQIVWDQKNSTSGQQVQVGTYVMNFNSGRLSLGAADAQIPSLDVTIGTNPHPGEVTF